MNSSKLNIWYVLSKNWLIGPFFFDSNTINDENYLEVLQLLLIPELGKLKKAH